MSESERKSNADAADRAAEGERQERLQAQAKADAQEALVRAEAQRRSLELQDAERAERLAAGPQRSPLKGSKVLETVGDAAAELGANSVSCLRFGVASMASSPLSFVRTERKGNARRVDAAAVEEGAVVRRSTRPVGAATLGTGLGLLGVGAALLILDGLERGRTETSRATRRATSLRPRVVVMPARVSGTASGLAAVGSF